MAIWRYRWNDGPWTTMAGPWASADEVRQSIMALNPTRALRAVLEVERGHQGGARAGAGRPPGSKTRPELRNPLPRDERVFASVTAHDRAVIELEADRRGVTPATFLAEYVLRRYRCRCQQCQAARRALRKAK